MPRTVFPLHPAPRLNKGKSFPESPTPTINIRKPVQTIDRIQLSIDSRCRDIILACFKAEFAYRGQYADKGNWVWGFMFDRCQIQVVRYDPKKPYAMKWTSIRMQDPSPLAQTKVAEIVKLALDTIGLPYSSKASVTQVEFALDIVPDSLAELGDLANLLQASLTMKHARAGSRSSKGTTHYLGKEGNVRRGAKGIRCYPKEGNRLRVELQANRDLLGPKGVTIESLPLAADFLKVQDYARFYQRLSSSAVAKIVTKLIPSLAKRRTLLAAMVRADVEGLLAVEHVVDQMDRIRQFTEKCGRKYDRGRLFTEWHPPL